MLYLNLNVELIILPWSYKWT